MQQRYAFLTQQLAVFQQPVVILDVEATGGDTQRDRITEIAFLRFDGDSVQHFSQLINPQQEISPFIEELTGISNEMVATAPTFAHTLPEILPLLRGAILMAHNSRFDYTMLRNECRRAGVALAMPNVCTVKLSRALYPNEYKHNLDVIAARFGLTVGEGRHRAWQDVVLLADFLQAAFQGHESSWKQCAMNLMQPALLPNDVPMWIREQLLGCTDDDGVVRIVVGDEVQFLLCEHVYREVVAWLLKHRHRWHEVNQLEWVETVGALHNLKVYAQWKGEGGGQWGQSGRHTIVFYQHNGCLKAKVRPLQEGIYAQPPTGVFWHPKGAKQAVREWANEQGICPNLLGILPYALPHDAPCPVAQVKGCSVGCEQQDMAAHNQQVREYSALLPTVDWWNAPRLLVREGDAVSGKTVDLVVERGALLLDNGLWLVSGGVLNVLKNKFKSARDSVSVI